MTMGCFFIFDYIVSFIVLLVIHAPWWAWLIYVVSVLFWLVVKVLSEDKETPEEKMETK